MVRKSRVIGSIATWLSALNTSEHLLELSRDALLRAKGHSQLIHALNEPLHAVIRREPVLALYDAAVASAALEKRLLEAKHVRGHLGADASLRAEGCNGDHRGEHAADLGVTALCRACWI